MQSAVPCEEHAYLFVRRLTVGMLLVVLHSVERQVFVEAFAVVRAGAAAAGVNVVGVAGVRTALVTGI